MLFYKYKYEKIEERLTRLFNAITSEALCYSMGDNLDSAE